MPPKSDYSFLDKLTYAQLERQLDAVTDDYVTQNLPGADVDAETKRKTEAFMTQIQKRMDKAVKQEPPAVETVVTTQVHQPYALDCAQFRSLLDKVEKFESGKEVSTFISDVENVYARIRAEIRDEKVVQHNFVSYVMGQMSTAYQQDLRNYESKNSDTVWTWSLFKEYLTKSYETSKTHFQILQALDKLDKSPGETNIDFSGRVEHYLTRIKTIVRARYQTKYGADHEVTADQVFDLMGSMALLRKLEKDDNLMNFLSRDLDDCFSPREIAKHADRYLERRQVADPVLTNPTVNFARNYSQNSNPKNETCRLFASTGQCTRQTCKYRHSKEPASKNYSNNGRGGRGRYRGRGSSRGRGRGHQGSSGDGRGGQRLHANVVNQDNSDDNYLEPQPHMDNMGSENHSDFHNGSV